MSNFVKALAIIACTWCVSETAYAQIGTTQPPNCPGRLIIDGKDEDNNRIFVHCECPDGNWAPEDQNGQFYCPSPQAQTIYQQPPSSYQQPAQTNPDDVLINSMMQSFGSQMGDALARSITKGW